MRVKGLVKSVGSPRGFNFVNGMSILSDEGDTLFHVHLVNGRLLVTSDGICHHEGKLYDEPINAVYLGQDKISIGREEYV